MAKLIPSNCETQSIVYTPKYLAEWGVNYFQPKGVVLDPCAGQKAFSSLIPNCLTCEIQEGTDFFDFQEKVNWIISNPPWNKIRPFLKHSYELADDIVFLLLINAIFMKARLRDMREANFGIKEIVEVNTPKENWPQMGLSLCFAHLQRNYSGDIKFSKVEI